MRPLSALALSALGAGAVFLAYSLAAGESTAYLVLIFPVVSAQGVAGLAGIALLGVGMLLAFLALARSFVPASEPSLGIQDAPRSAGPGGAAGRRPFGGVVFLGPIPIVFGSDVRVSKVMLAAAIILSVLLIGLFLFVLRGT